MFKKAKAKFFKKPKAAHGLDSPVTNDTIEDHRQQILKRARKLVKPLGLSRRKFLSFTISIAAGVVVLFFILFSVLIYGFKSDSDLVYRVARIIPYPVARINGDWLSYGDYLFELNYQKNALQRTQSSNAQSQAPTIDFSTPEGQTQLKQLRQSALTQAEQKLIIAQLAQEHGLSVNKDELETAVNDTIQSQGGKEQFLQAINYFYGWTLNDFRRVMKQELLKRKLAPVFSSKERALAERLLTRIKNGANFAKLARQYSQDSASKAKGGNLGTATRGSYVKEFEDAAFALQPGQVSGVVETRFGYHIIKLLGKSGDQIKVAHILIQYGNVDQVIADKLSAASTHTYVKIEPAPTPPGR